MSKKVLPKLASMLFNSHIVNISSNFVFVNSKTAPNTTSLDGFALPCVSCALMGFATFVVSKLNYSVAFGFTNECMA